ncbi:MAG: flagellin [Deltaproteobacteria bacterium]|nr:flagellin [Deltaproteobacteria bacterium]
MSITLTAGMRSNLMALQSTNKLMELTQTRLSTGMKVNTALDDPVNFFKAKDHRDRASDLSAKKDGMNEAIKTIEGGNTAVEGIYDLLDQMASLARAAKTASSTNAAALTSQYYTIASQIGTMAQDANYGGVNLLQGDDLTVDFNEDGTNTLTITAFSITDGGDRIAGASIATGYDFSSATSITSAIAEIDAAISSLRTESQKLASNLSTIQIRADFTDNMINTLETGADALTLADMNEEGANMLMLQTRQALGTTSLSLSSQAAQSVLRLF